jgi:anti-sigma B factor antagonist
MDDVPSARLDIESHAGDRRLRLEGDIDSHTAGDLEAALAALGTSGEVLLDVAGVGFIDSSGLRVVVSVNAALVDAGHALRIRGASPAVVRLVEITGLGDHLDVEESSGEGSGT